MSMATWRIHFTRCQPLWPADPRPLLALRERAHLDAWLDAEDIPDGLPSSHWPGGPDRGSA
jgi:hypothetical protein